MTGAVRVVCRPETAPGFELAGLFPVEAASPAAASEAVLALAQDPEIGLVLVQDDLAPDLRGLERRIGGPLPLLIPFPAPAGPPEVGAADYVAEILRRAVGYRVRL